jgi:hypothetical protein
MTGDDLILYMGRFIKHTVVRKDKPVLIVLDSDRPHLDMTVLDLAMYVGVVTSLPPPHLSHSASFRMFVYRLQFVNIAYEAWIRSNSGKIVTFCDVRLIVS